VTHSDAQVRHLSLVFSTVAVAGFSLLLSFPGVEATDKEVDDVISKAHAMAVSAGDVTKGGSTSASAVMSAERQAQVTCLSPCALGASSPLQSHYCPKVEIR
jgi:hypothetical protein